MKDYYLYLDPDDGILYVQKDGEVIAPVRTSASFDPSSLRIRNGFLEVKDFTSDKWEYICDEKGHPASLLGPSGYSALLDLSNDVVSVKVDNEYQLDGAHTIKTKVRYYVNDTHIGITESDISIDNPYNYTITKELIPGNNDSYILVTIQIPTKTIIRQQQSIKIQTNGSLHHATKNLTIIPIDSRSTSYNLECLPSVIMKNSDDSFSRDQINIVVLEKHAGKSERVQLPTDYQLVVKQNGQTISSISYNDREDLPAYYFNLSDAQNYTDPIIISLMYGDKLVDETVHEFLTVPEIQAVTVEDIEKLQAALDEKRPSRYIKLTNEEIVELENNNQTQDLVDKYSFKDGDWTIAHGNQWLYQDGEFIKTQDILSIVSKFQTSHSNNLNTKNKTIEGAINELFNYVQSGTGVTYSTSYFAGEDSLKYIKISSQSGNYTTNGNVTSHPGAEPYNTACIIVNDYAPVLPIDIVETAQIVEIGQPFTISDGQNAYLVFASKDYLESCKGSDKDVYDQCPIDVTITVSNFILTQEVSTYGLRSESLFIEVPLESKVFIPAGSIQSKKSILIKPVLDTEYISMDGISEELVDQLHKEILQHPNKKLTIGGFYIEIDYTNNTVSPNLTSLTAIYDSSMQLQSYLAENPLVHLSISDIQYVTTEGIWAAV